jgi:hypothetical protein
MSGPAGVRSCSVCGSLAMSSSLNFRQRSNKRSFSSFIISILFLNSMASCRDGRKSNYRFSNRSGETACSKRMASSNRSSRIVEIIILRRLSNGVKAADVRNSLWWFPSSSTIQADSRQLTIRTIILAFLPEDKAEYTVEQFLQTSGPEHFEQHARGWLNDNANISCSTRAGGNISWRNSQDIDVEANSSKNLYRMDEWPAYCPRRYTERRLANAITHHFRSEFFLRSFRSYCEYRLGSMPISKTTIN